MTSKPGRAPVQELPADLLDLTAELSDPYCMAPDAAARLLRDLPWKRLAVVGDSVTAGVMDPLPGYRDRP